MRAHVLLAPSQSYVYLTIEVNDNKASDILTCIPATNIFIESALESGGSVLVHWCVYMTLCVYVCVGRVLVGLWDSLACFWV